MSKFRGANSINIYSSLDVLPPTIEKSLEKHRAEEAVDTYVFTKIQLARLINGETEEAYKKGFIDGGMEVINGRSTQ